MTDAVAAALAAIDTDRLVDLVARVCRIPSVLGDEGPLAEFLARVMRGSGFEGVGAAARAPGPAERDRRVSLRAGTARRADRPHGHQAGLPRLEATEPFSGALIDGSVYGHGVMDMKAALVCQIVAIEAVRASGLPLSGTLAMAAVSDHMGDQLGSIAYFDEHQADLCVLGELTDNEVCLGHRGRYYFDVTTLGALGAHLPQAARRSTPTSWPRRPCSRSTPRSTSPRSSRGSWICSARRPTWCPDGSTAGLPPGGPSMIPDECVIRVDCRPQPGVTIEQVRAEIDRCLDARRGGATRASAPRSCSPT